jgi:AbrB family looped-hinge helix DNA binding protein
VKHKLFGTVTVGTKGQVVIPVDARNNMNIKTGDRLYVIGVEHGKFLGLMKEESIQEQIDHMSSTKEFLQNIINKDN